MAETTGPVLAIGAISVANRTIFNDKPMDWRIPAAAGLAAVAFAGAERLWGQGARALAWTALIAVCLTRIEHDVPSPVESALIWWEKPPRQGKQGSGRERGPRSANV